MNRKKEGTMHQRTQRKGQITIFIIIAIIILFIGAIALYLQSSSTKIRPAVQQLEVSDEVKPVQTYVTECLKSTSKDALITLGNMGGYTEIKGMVVSPVPYVSDALLFEPQVLPYWYYVKDDCANKQSYYGCISSKKPSLCKMGTDCVVESRGPVAIEDQLNTYIEKNIASCINDFVPFNNQFTINAGAIAVDSRVTDAGVTFKLDYPLDITAKGTTKNINIPYFVTQHDVKLKEIYALASEIAQTESDYHFLEQVTLNFITAYSGVDSDLLPPTAGLELFLAEKKYWIRSEVKDVLMNDVLPFMNLVQVVNAGGAFDLLSPSTNPADIPIEEGFYRNLLIKTSNNTYFDLNAHIIYPSSDIYFRIGNSEIIKPRPLDVDNNFVTKLSGLFMTEYAFKYDLTYPVIIQINDPEAFGGEGYTFNYAMEANIRQNVPLKGNVTLVDATGEPRVDLFSPEQRPERTIIIESYDKHTDEPLEGVTVTYRCGPEFTIGQTYMEHGRAILKERFPYCEFGGELAYEKNGYMGSSISFNNPDGSDDKYIRLELWPLQKKTVKVLKRTPANVEFLRTAGPGSIALYGTQAVPLSENDSVFLTTFRAKENPSDTDVPLLGFGLFKTNTFNPQESVDSQLQQITELYDSGSINKSTYDDLAGQLTQFPESLTEPIATTPTYEMEFVPGTYIVDAMMMYHGLINISAETRSVCAGPKVLGVCAFGEKTIHYPQQSFDTWVNGGAQINFTLSENDVYSDGTGTLIIYVLEMPLPQNWDMIENYELPEDYQQGRLFLIRPRLEP